MSERVVAQARALTGLPRGTAAGVRPPGSRPVVHSLQTIHKRFYKGVGRWVVNAGFHTHLPDTCDWQSVEKYNQYRHFWELIIAATLVNLSRLAML